MENEGSTISHRPVLVREILSFADRALNEVSHPLILDATLGEAGHTLALHNRFPGGIFLANDRDSGMLARAHQVLSVAGVSERPFIPDSFPEPGVHTIRGPFSALAGILELSRLHCDLILIDLGVSLFHFVGAGRGFSHRDESLDMRLDEDLPHTAKDYVNGTSEAELAEIFRTFGEERYSGRIAAAIVRSRPIESARELGEIVLRALPGKSHPRSTGRRFTVHPAVRVFQALRIVVNRELEELEAVLKEIPARLNPGGILAVISFHSLEDRIVKRRFREIGIRERPIASPRAAWKRKGTVGEQSEFLILTPRPVRPGAIEIEENPASRSARLRVLKRSTENERAER